MANNQLATHILLRYDKYSRWMSSDVILQPGEAAIATFPDVDPNNPPRAFGVKVGDGRRYFDELPWIQALASDVYEWAKDPQKPVYQATEISGLAEYIAAHSSGGGGGSSGGSGSYQIVWDPSVNKYILQQWDETADDWVNTASEIDLSGLLNRVDTIERWANGARTKLGVIEMPLDAYVYEEVVNELNRLDVLDEAVPGQYVTSVAQNNGQIIVSREAINASTISTGILSTEHGGTGLSRVDEDQVLIGTIEGNITTKTFVTTIDEYDRNSFATTGAIIAYVLQKTAGLTGAMHFIGETSVVIDSSNSRVNPQIPGYDFSKAQAGDVILANNAQEYVWTGSNWRLLGDEGSYAVKGSIVNADISDQANIAQSKIADLEETFNTKVDKVEGKGLSTNDYSNEAKNKLDNIESEAQVNVIEHIFFNDEEALPTTVSGQPKSIDLHFNGMTVEQGEKLEGIEEGAQVNVIEHIKLNDTEIQPDANKTVNIELVEYTTEEKEKLATVAEGAEPNTIETIIMDGVEQTPDEDGVLTLSSDPHTDHINRIEHIFLNGQEVAPTTVNSEPKSVNIVIDAAALNLQVLEGARYPTGNNTYADVDITNKKLELARIAASGNVSDLLQTQDTYIILDCGSSTDVI